MKRAFLVGFLCLTSLLQADTEAMSIRMPAKALIQSQLMFLEGLDELDEQEKPITCYDNLTAPTTYYVKELKQDGNVLVLSNGSEWNINWYWKDIGKNWNAGDAVKMTLQSSNVFYPSYKVDNIANGETIWVDLFDAPTTYESDYIVGIENELVTFSNGIVLKAKHRLNIAQWYLGDIIMFFNSEHTPNGCSVINFNQLNWVDGFEVVDHVDPTDAGMSLVENTILPVVL